MDIKALFILRSDSETPELLTAWDEFSIDENPQGFEEDCRKQLESLKGDYIVHQVITLSVPTKDVLELLSPQKAIRAGVIFPPSSKNDVHTRHCCRTCGCKYGDEYCTVTRGILEQERECDGLCNC